MHIAGKDAGGWGSPRFDDAGALAPLFPRDPPPIRFHAVRFMPGSTLSVPHPAGAIGRRGGRRARPSVPPVMKGLVALTETAAMPP